jgi:hypothetical protein
MKLTPPGELPRMLLPTASTRKASELRQSAAAVGVAVRVGMVVVVTLFSPPQPAAARTRRKPDTERRPMPRGYSAAGRIATVSP